MWTAIKSRFFSSVKKRLATMIVVAIVPFLSMVIYLLISLVNYNRVYEEIINNVTIANKYNLVFKENLDESTYKLVVGAVTFDNIHEDPSLQNPYQMIANLRADSMELMQFTTDRESLAWLQSLQRNLDTLQARMNDLKENIDEGGHYDENIGMLDNNIYILTELIQDDMQHYIYYQAKSITSLQKSLNQQVKSFLLADAMIVAALLILVCFIAIKITLGITKPLENVTGVTEKISKGDFSVRALQVGTEEVNTLSTAVNDMAANLEIMVNQIKDDERKMRVTELRLLQEQINPHFLYNTLDTIMWLIEGNKGTEAERMVESLSNFFRLVLSKGREYITIEDEKEHILSYLQIQQVRYQDILDYEIEIPEEMYPYTILKLTLQPLVENALYHGIKYKRAKGVIKISGFIEHNTLNLFVEDNGVGMEPGELERLQQEILKPCQETKKGFGLANVNERIKMNYGNEYGLTIYSKKGSGTKVCVTLPARLEEEATIG